jgi:hypothetical protein
MTLIMHINLDGELNVEIAYDHFGEFSRVATCNWNLVAPEE